MHHVIESLEPRTLLSARLVADIIPGPESSVALGARYANRCASGSNFYFSAVSAGHGLEPFVSSPAGTFMLKDINPGDGSSEPRLFTPGSNGKAYFIAQDQMGFHQVWRTDGTPANTVQISHFTFDPSIDSLREVNGNLIFLSFSISKGIYKVSAGATTPTKLTDTVNPTALPLESPSVAGGKFYFKNFDNNSLWWTNGTTTQMVQDLGVANTVPILGSAVFQDKLFYAADITGSGYQLYRTDGTPGGTVQISNIASGGVRSLVVSGNYLYFLGKDGSGFHIYRSDGTGYNQVSDLPATTDPQAVDALSMADFNGTIFFRYASRLYKLVNGTTAQRVGSATGGVDGGTKPAFLTAAGNALYFSGIDLVGKARLFQTDGTTITAVTGDAGFTPSNLTNVGGTLFYQADDDAHGFELHAAGDFPITPLTARLKVHTNSQGHTTTIDEGETVTFEAITSGPSIKAYYWDFGDGVLRSGGRKVSKTFEDNLPEDAPRTIRLKVVTNDNRAKNVNVSNFLVRNVSPKIKFYVPPTFVTFAPMPWSAFVTDPGKNDNVKVRIIWGDGSATEQPVPAGGGTVSGVHVFTSPQIDLQNIKAYANDKDGGSDNAFRTVPITSFSRFLPDDPLNKLLGLSGMFVSGTSGNDRIKVQKSIFDDGRVGVRVFMNDLVDRQVVPTNGYFSLWLGEGDDRVEIAPDVPNPVNVHRGGTAKVIPGGGPVRVFPWPPPP